MKTQCPSCSANIEVPLESLGESVVCPSCNAEVPAPEKQPDAECEFCWSIFQVNAELMGKRLQCPTCNKVTKIQPKSPRVVVSCRNCHGNISVPQNRIGWMVNCPLCNTETKVIESHEAEFLVNSDDDEVLVVDNLEDLVTGTALGTKTVKPSDASQPPIGNIAPTSQQQLGLAPANPATPALRQPHQEVAYDPIVLDGPPVKRQQPAAPKRIPPQTPPKQPTRPSDSQAFDPVVLGPATSKSASKSGGLSGSASGSARWNSDGVAPAPKPKPQPAPAAKSTEAKEFKKQTGFNLKNILVTGVAAIVAIGIILTVFSLFMAYVVNSRKASPKPNQQHPGSVLSQEDRLAE